MTAIFLDTNVFLYAAGADHPLRDASQQILRRVAEGDLQATINTEVLQEILFVLTRRDWRERALDLARSAALLFPDILPVTRYDMLTACDLIERYPQLRTRDAVHVATMLNNGIDSILTADGHFNDVIEIQAFPIKA